MVNDSDVRLRLLDEEKKAKFVHLIQELNHQQEERIHKHHEQEISAEVFLFLVISLQALICLFQAKRPKRFQEITFFFLALYPLSIFYHAKHVSMIAYGFIFLWLCWGSFSLQLMYKAMGPPFAKKKWVLEKIIPQKVYQWFLRTHRICYSLAGFSLLLFFIFPGSAFVLLFICLYFGVLGRDCAEICTTKISSSIGYIHYEVPPENVCALCGEELVPTLDIMLGNKSPDDPEIIENPTVTLDCKHTFHKRCILGWTMVGKKDTCPFCKEKVHFEEFITEKAWNSPRLQTWWVGCLVVMRYLLVWNPIVSYAALYFLKIFHFEPLVDSHGKPLY